MCIRDSTLAEALLSRGASLRLPVVSGVLVGLAGVFVIASACLLYTSDAADERSSVDLGGRRIIKKKKYIATRVDSIMQETTETTMIDNS